MSGSEICKGSHFKGKTWTTVRKAEKKIAYLIYFLKSIILWNFEFSVVGCILALR